MAINLDDVQTFTDAQILVVLRAALVNASVATQYSIGGRQLIRSSPGEVQKLIEKYETRVAEAAAAPSGGIAIVRYGERV